MSSQRVTFLLCLLVSAAVHAALLVTLTRYVNRQVASKPETKTPTYRVAIPEPPPPPDLFGEKNAKGDAINSSPGDAVQTSPLSRPDQAALTRDPTGQGPAARPQQPPSQPQPLSRPVTSPPPAAVPTPPPSPAPAFRKPNKPTPAAPETPPKEQPTETAESPIAKATPQTPPAPPTPPTPAGGRPMPHSDRDSDPFAKQASVEFKRGRIAARSGREVKFTRPRENLSAMVEAAEIAFPLRLRLKVGVDVDGHVRRAEIIRSSGSPSIDRAFLLATYDSWFEPAKDPQGRPVTDEVEFNIVLE